MRPIILAQVRSNNLYHILYIEDDPLMRDLVERSLARDPTLTSFGCDSGEPALAAVADRAPDLILCDVNMPGMDGPAMLARFRQDPATAEIPLLFVTARAPPSEVTRLISLGAVGVIAKPFVPSTLAATLCSFIAPGKRASDAVDGEAGGNGLSDPKGDFAVRLRADRAKLAALRLQMVDSTAATRVPDGLQTCVHQLAGAAGILNYLAVSKSASTLEDAIVARLAGRGVPGAVETNLDDLIECMRS